jgi:hypothetical protein
MLSQLGAGGTGEVYRARDTANSAALSGNQDSTRLGARNISPVTIMIAAPQASAQYSIFST